MGTLATATVATIASCTKEAAKFENYMADVVKYVDGLADATGKISDKVADNGKTSPQPPSPASPWPQVPPFRWS